MNISLIKSGLKDAEAIHSMQVNSLKNKIFSLLRNIYVQQQLK